MDYSSSPMTIETTGQRPQTANLEDPLYYLSNMDTIVSWVADHHSDLLTDRERNRLAAYKGLATGSRALLTRMVMRTGELFRADKLLYPELPVPEAEALKLLVQEGWLNSAPELSLDDLFRLFTLAELRPVFGGWLQQQGYPKPWARRRCVSCCRNRSARHGPCGTGWVMTVKLRKSSSFRTWPCSTASA